MHAPLYLKLCTFKISKALVAAILLSVCFFLLKCALANSDPAAISPRCGLTGNVKDAKTEKQTPIIIWFYHLEKDSLQSLEIALSSSIPTHISIYVRNRWTGKLLRKKKNVDKLKKAIGIAKKYKLKSILVRNLWPTYPMGDLDESILYNPKYYLGEIASLRQEGQRFRSDFVGFDVEPYHKAPVGRYLQWKYNYRPSSKETKKLKQVISDVIRKSGKVDFLYPAGSVRAYHFYNLISSLGEKRIAESTYYDTEDYLKIDYPYEIFGVYVSVLRSDPSIKSFSKPYYQVNSVFQKNNRWSSKEGLFLYPREDRVLDVANALFEYSKNHVK